ncbi:MAG: FecR family protein [Treponema sp.]|nr:FecR family protein [Treponema sp.]
MKSLAVLIIMLQTAAAAFAQNGEAFIRELTGTVGVKPPGAAEWTQAAAGDRIVKEASISTGFRSMAILVVGSSVITVQALTSLTLEEIINMSNTETVNLELRTGRIRTDVNPPAGVRTSFVVRTPMATASVRGTSFELDALNIRVSEGMVKYDPITTAGARPILVNAGQSSWIDADTGKVANPFTAAQANRALPELPGQSDGAGDSAGLEISQGSVSIELNFSGE